MLNGEMNIKDALIGLRQLAVSIERRENGNSFVELARDTATFRVESADGSSEWTIDISAAKSPGIVDGEIAGTLHSPWDLAFSRAPNILKTGTESGPSRAAYFDAVYQQNFWRQGVQNNDSCPSSGSGSAISVTTPARLALSEIIRTYDIATVLDLPCGDISWLLYRDSEVPAPLLGTARYVGADVSKVVIERNIADHLKSGSASGDAFAQRPWRFEIADAVSGPEFPRLAAELLAAPGPMLVLCRHMMLHLPPADNLAALQRLEGSGAHFLLLTTFLRSNSNNESFVLAGGHPVNLFRRPYCLRDPLRLYPDNGRDVFLGLWALPHAYEREERGNVPPLMDPAYCLE